MKYRYIVEYDYPVAHKPPVKAELILHGDKVVTDKIEIFGDKMRRDEFPIVKEYCRDKVVAELEKIKQEIGRIQTEEGGDFLERPAIDIIYESQKILDNHISELKGE